MLSWRSVFISIYLFLRYLKIYTAIVISMFQKKFLLQTGTTADGVSVIDVVPIDQGDSTEEKPLTVSAIVPSNHSGGSSPNSLTSSTSQQLTAQVAVVQTQSDSEPHYITVTGE